MAFTCSDPYLAPGKWYKGNLHTHTTESDGRLAPAEVIRRYRQSGYDFLSITDHNKRTIVAPHEAAGMLMIPGEELDFYCSGVFHVVAIGTHTALSLTAEQRASLKPAEAFAAIRAAGGEAILAHPYWSNEQTENVLMCGEALGVEVYNHGCETDNGNGCSVSHWDDMLRAKMRTYAFATDDSHHHGRNGEVVADAFGGWIMVKAQSLTQDHILEAIRKGHFYASSGPEIKGIRFEDGRVHVECSPVKSICLRTPQWGGWCARNIDGSLMSHAGLTVPQKGMVCGRIECTDETGRKAWSNPFWVS